MPEPPDELERIFSDYSRRRETVAEAVRRRRPLPTDRLLAEVRAAAAHSSGAEIEMEKRLRRVAGSRGDIASRVRPLSQPQLDELLSEVRQRRGGARIPQSSAWDGLRRRWKEWRHPWLVAFPALAASIVLLFVFLRFGREAAPNEPAVVLAMGLPADRGGSLPAAGPALPITFELRLPSAVRLVESNGTAYAGQLIEDPARREAVDAVLKRSFTLKARGTNAAGQPVDITGILRLNTEIAGASAGSRVVFAVLEEARAVVGTNQVIVPRLESLNVNRRP